METKEMVSERAADWIRRVAKVLQESEEQYQYLTPEELYLWAKEQNLHQTPMRIAGRAYPSGVLKDRIRVEEGRLML